MIIPYLYQSTTHILFFEQGSRGIQLNAPTFAFSYARNKFRYSIINQCESVSKKRLGSGWDFRLMTLDSRLYLNQWELVSRKGLGSGWDFRLVTHDSRLNIKPCRSVAKNGRGECGDNYPLTSSIFNDKIIKISKRRHTWKNDMKKYGNLL